MAHVISRLETQIVNTDLRWAKIKDGREEKMSE